MLYGCKNRTKMLFLTACFLYSPLQSVLFPELLTLVAKAVSKVLFFVLSIMPFPHQLNPNRNYSTSSQLPWLHQCLIFLLAQCSAHSVLTHDFSMYHRNNRDSPALEHRLFNMMRTTQLWNSAKEF